jgi:hypothetical protein
VENGMTDAEKLELIRQYVSSLDNVELSEDIYSKAGGNIDDAYSMGIEYGESYAANHILFIIGEK